MLSLLYRYTKKYLLNVFLVVLFVIAQVFCELAIPTIMADIVDNGLEAEGGFSFIAGKGLLMLAVSLGQTAAMIGVGFLSSRVSAATGRDIKSALFAKAQTFSQNEMNRIGVSSMITRCTRDVTTIQNFMVMCMRMVLVSPIMLAGSIILMLGINKRLAFIVFASIPVLAMLFAFILVNAGRLFDLLQKKNDQINTLLREHLSGTRVIRAFANQKTEQAKFGEANDELCMLSTKVNRLMSLSMPGMMMTINLTNVCICAFGAGQVELGNIYIGQLMSFIQYVTMLLMSLGMLSILIAFAPRAQVSAKRIEEVINTEVSIKDNGNSNPVCRDGEIEFRDVSFTYENGDAPVISHVSFVAEAGKTTAIVGPTGSGKSTVVSLIARLYDVSQGRILLDGNDIRSYSLENLRDRLGIAMQKAVLFSGSIADNVRFGCSHASEKDVKEALCTSQAWDFVSSMDKGIDSFISQGGKNISGGQKQRLSIARAIVRNCEVYVFDDSFSALDYETDSNLRESLETDSHTCGKTKIIIAQRISTVINADRIIVLNNGEVAGIGTHRELLGSCPLYREIASSQLSEEELVV